MKKKPLQRPDQEKVDKILEDLEVFFAPHPDWPGMAVPYGALSLEQVGILNNMGVFDCNILAKEVKWLRAELKKKAKGD